MMRVLRRIDSAWRAAEILGIGLALAAIIVLGAGQILLRNLADSGWIWADALIRHLVLLAGFLGGSVAAADGRHITIDALSRFFRGRGLRIVRAVTAAATAAVSLALCLAAWDFVRMERAAGGNLLAGLLPVWIVQLAIPYAFASVAIRSVTGFWLRTGDPT